MFRNILAAAIRNLARNRLYAFLNVAGLAVGLAVALLVASVVFNQTSYDRFIPDHQRTYLLTLNFAQPGVRAQRLGRAPLDTGPALAAELESVEAVTRLALRNAVVRKDDLAVVDRVDWVDPNFLHVLPLPAHLGDAAGALRQADGAVLTELAAQKYFGGAAQAIGKVLLVDERPMTVRAVLRDLPSTTHLTGEIFLSGLAAGSPLSAQARSEGAEFTGTDGVATYVRLRRGAQLQDVETALVEFARSHVRVASGATLGFDLLPLAEVHLRGPEEGSGKPGGNIGALYALSAVGFLVLLVAASNFVNLMTARATRRATEVGVRKAFGASRQQLIAQFIGESLVHTALAMLGAVMLAELAMPHLNAFMNTDVEFAYWRDPALVAVILGMFIGVGVLAGAYPALVLSAFAPAAVVKAGGPTVGGSSAVRQILVVVQFAVLIGFGVATLVVYKQTLFAINRGLRLDQQHILIVRGPCDDGVRATMERVPGVLGSACSGSAPLLEGPTALASASSARTVTVRRSVVAPGLLDLYGYRRLAGRFPDQARPSDSVARDAQGHFAAPVVLNEAAVRALGFSNPSEAVGRPVPWIEGGASQVLGVVEDFPVGRITDNIQPAAYYADAAGYTTLSLRLDGARIPETTAAVDAVWNRLHGDRPIDRFFFDSYVESLYLAVRREAEALGLFAGITLLIACLGLLGLAAFTAERRTKEIGVRKALGASTQDVLRLLLWQFTRPVLLANLIAWPAAYLLLNAWLQSFAYRIALSPFDFLAISCVAVAVAWLTVFTQTLLVARSPPVRALRYE